MVCRDTGRLFRLTVVAALIALGLALPAAAQNMVSGKVTDMKGQPVEGATITVEQGATGRKFQAKTNKNGEFTQVGLPSGAYVVTASKEGVGEAKGNVSVRGGSRAPANFVLGSVAAVRGPLEEGIGLTAAGDFDAAIAKFNEALKTTPQCPDCYYHIGIANAEKKDYAAAEAAFNKSIEIKPTTDAYDGLVSIYTQQRKTEAAEEAGKKAAELSAAASGGVASPEALYNKGVVLWNSGKVVEAKGMFEKALAADPNHAEAHYQLAMAMVNEGNLKGAATEFETYLKLSPDGPNAAQAKAIASQLPK
jgi:Flp pilus assembly protein TadD